MSGLPSNSSSNSAPSLNHVDRLDYPRVCCWCGGDIHSTHWKTVGRTHNHHLLLWAQVYPSLLGYVNHSVVNSLYTSITIFNKSRGLSNSCGSTLDKVGCNLCKKEPEFCSGQGLRVNWSSCWVVGGGGYRLGVLPRKTQWGFMYNASGWGGGGGIGKQSRGNLRIHSYLFVCFLTARGMFPTQSRDFTVF